MTRALVLALAAAGAAAWGVTELGATLIRADRGTRARTIGGARTRRLRRAMRAAVPAARAIGLEQRLAQAGAPRWISAGDVVAARWLGGLVGVAVAVVGVGVLGGRAAVATAVLAPAGGFMAPDALLARRRRRRGRTMAAELPELLELIAVLVAAGMAPLRALGEVGRRRSGPLARELARAAARAQLGVRHDVVLDELRARCPLGGAGALVAALRRSQRHGAPLAPALAALSTQAHAAASQRLREQAARAGPKIQLVVALLLVPSVMLVVAAALAVALGSPGG